MAAAMLLSAVPAVTMPSFVSKAGQAQSATSTSSNTYADNFLKGGDEIPAKIGGEVFSFRANASALAGSNVVITDIIKPSVVKTGNASDAFVSLVNATIVQDSADSGIYHVNVALKTGMSNAEKSTFVNSVKQGTNCFKIKLIAKRDNLTAAEVTSDKNYLGTALGMKDSYEMTIEGTKIYWIGGQYVNGRMIVGVTDDNNYLVDGNVYAKIDKVTSDGIAELELIKQAKNENNKLKDNDNLRGNTLDLTTIHIGNVEYKVGKLGSQCLKEAKMKKLLAKNVSKVYKGALRKCKQVKTVNMKDKNKIRKINTKAFYNCKNLKHIIIDGRKLNSVGKDSFKGLKKNCKVKIKASKSKFNQDVKKIKKANPNAKLKFARIAP
jgi:hypothetical protein